MITRDAIEAMRTTGAVRRLLGLPAPEAEDITRSRTGGGRGGGHHRSHGNRAGEARSSRCGAGGGPQPTVNEGGAIEFAGDRARHLGGADAGGENPGLARHHGVRVLAHGVVRGAVHSVDGVHLFDVLSLGHLAERNLTRTRLQTQLVLQASVRFCANVERWQM